MESSPVSNQALPAGTRIEEFVIERVLGSGGFGITYLARDTSLGRQVVIKENLPVQFCFRDTHSLTVAPRHSHGEDAENFKWSLENFSKEAAMLASLDHSGIVRVHRSFEAFGTAYFVMPFVEGLTLDDLIRERGGKNPTFTEEELRGLLERMLSALSYLHDRGIYHRDIKPGNLLITNDGIPVLIDFGSARQRLSERSMTVVESAGYTPFEQLQSRGNVGPWSDLYALGATLVKVITGEAPPKTNDRSFGDPWLPLAGRVTLAGRFSRGFLSGIDRSLKLPVTERWQEAGEWLVGLRMRTIEIVSAERHAVTGSSMNELKRDITQPAHAALSKSSVVETSKAKILPWIITAGLVLGLYGLEQIISAQKAQTLSVTAVEARVKEESVAKSEREKLSLPGSQAGEKRDFEIASGVKITMCWIPPGEFMMGSPTSEVGRQEDETQHLVTIGKGFWLAQTETTQAQWQAVMGNNPSFNKGWNLPVEQVSWDAIAGRGGFIEKVNQDADMEGCFALPTEAQWEYACRAGTTEAYAGDLDGMAWYGESIGSKPHLVAGKRANSWGLHDMCGNVSEWCADRYKKYSDEAVTDPKGGSSNTYRVYRGGGWYSNASSCRAAHRSNYGPSSTDNSIGFRLALSSVVAHVKDEADTKTQMDKPSLPASAAGIGVVAKLDRESVLAGNGALMTLKISGGRAAGAPEIPEVENLIIQPRGESTQMQIINGRHILTDIHTFVVGSKTPGDYQIPVIEVTVDGKKYSTQTLKLRVIDNDAAKSRAESQIK